MKVLPFARYDAGRASPYHQTPPTATSADSEFANSNRLLRDWARHLADNSAIVNAILSSRVSNAVGPGLSYEPLTRDRKGNLLTELNDAIKRVHERWSRSADVTGELSRPELERQAWRCWDLDGESFARRVNLRFTKDSRELPYHVQLMKSEWVPANLTGVYDGTRLVHGIQKDDWGRPQFFYIEPNVTDITNTLGVFLKPSSMLKLPADQVWHLKRTQQPGQTRGVTLLHAIIFRVHDIAEFEQSHRLAARASADLWASINRDIGFDPSLDSTRGEETANGKTKNTWEFEHLQMIDGLAPGESVNFHSPQHPNQNAVDFVREELRHIASACDVGFSQVAQVFDSSYAAQRLEVVDTWRKVERDRSKFISDFARPALYEQVVEAARLTGQLPARAMRKLDPETFLDARIDGPTMPVIDPVKDRQAFALDQGNGWDSRPGIIRRMGKRPADIDAEIKSDDLSDMGKPEPVKQNDQQDQNQEDEEA